VTLVAKTPAQQPKGTPPPGAPATRFGFAGKPLIALTQDQRLLATLQQVADPQHEVETAGSELDLSAALMTHHAGVAVLDCAAVASPIDQLAARLAGQFPELVLIVAGGIDDQGRLAAQITDGTVHRFLHKPVSEQRVRLFVEAAWRRHEEEAHALPRMTATRPAQPGARTTRWWLPALALAAVVAGAAVWFGQQNSAPPAAAPPAPHPSSAATGGDPELEALLKRADDALAAGALTAPAGANAAELYREARRRNARDPRAASGLEQVISRLLADAEAQLQANHLDEAQQLADAARAINPGHPRVTFVATQIDQQRERALLGKAQRAAASGNVAGALAVLDNASRSGPASTVAAEARNELARQQVDTRVTDFLARGRDAMSRGRLIAPAQDNANFYIASARALAAADPAVQRAAQDLSTRLVSEGRQALAARNIEQTESWAAAAAEAGADAGEVADLRAGAQQLRGAARADSFAKLALAFNERLSAGKFIEPAADSAKSYLAQLTQADANNPATQQARTAYNARLFDEERNALQGHDFTAAHRWLEEARGAGADGAALSAAGAALAAAEQQAQQAGSSVAESSLSRTRYVAPDFPRAAREKGITGWVDVQFVVGPDGAVSDANIVGAQPVGIFEQAALDAVRRWRYRPVLQGGQVISQRTRVRVRFAMQP
jgi:TonB family protein